jgi:hypothetical protein
MIRNDQWEEIDTKLRENLGEYKQDLKEAGVPEGVIDDRVAEAERFIEVHDSRGLRAYL